LNALNAEERQEFLQAQLRHIIGTVMSLNVLIVVLKVECNVMRTAQRNCGIGSHVLQ
jgi:2-phospho-L-lactate guanylyltransferase (CobY/MobA/RfbA family)